MVVIAVRESVHAPAEWRIADGSPALGGVGSVVVFALTLNVGNDGPEVGGTEGLGPVAILPSKGMPAGNVAVQLVRRGAFESLHQVAERHAAGEPNDDVDVIQSASNGEHGTPNLVRLAAQDRKEALVEGRRKQRAAA